MEFVVSSDKKLLPYGMMNFADIRLDGYYYVDKTMYIPLIERSNRYFFFIRPRRFGKSLTLNICCNITMMYEPRINSTPCLETST